MAEPILFHLTEREALSFGQTDDPEVDHVTVEIANLATRTGRTVVAVYQGRRLAEASPKGNPWPPAPHVAPFSAVLAWCDTTAARLDQEGMPFQVKVTLRAAQTLLERLNAPELHRDELAAALLRTSSTAATAAATLRHEKPSHAKEPAASSSKSIPEVMDAIAKEQLLQLDAESAPIHLVWVPSLARAVDKARENFGLGKHLVAKAWNLQAWLLIERNIGAVELRPESGVGRLSATDRKLCPIDGDNTPLSHVRIIKKG